MRPPYWLNHSHENAELEALQTDVMRFVAILGLCLAAIFSLVHSAALEQEAASADGAGSAEKTELLAVQAGTQSPASAEEPLPAASVARASPQPVTATPSVAPDSKAGFTLEFASVRALKILLERGEVKLYAHRGAQFWQLDYEKGFAASDAPASYYDMDETTVPEDLRNTMTEPSGGMVWGVTLPEAISKRIEELTGQARSGKLLIQEDNAVILEGHGQQ